MAKRGRPKRLFKSQDRVSSYQPGSGSSGKLLKRMSRDHMDVLQNIEFVLAKRYREQGDVDDRAVSEALHACLTHTAPQGPMVTELVDDLRAIREFRTDVPDDVWRDGLRVVADSVRTHSQLRPGETSYLSFVSPYVR